MRVFAATAAVAAAALILAAPAHADEQSFLDAARAAGYVNDDQEILRNGYGACALRGEAGNSDIVGKAIGAALRFLGHNTTDEQSEEFVNLAVTHLCPMVVQ